MAKKRSSSEDPASGSGSSELDFEQTLEQVERIVGDLESGELGLTQSLKQYELGIKRLNQCHQLLEAAEQKITLLSGVDPDGNLISKPFSEIEATEGEATKAGRRSRSEINLAAPDEANDGESDDSPQLF